MSSFGFCIAWFLQPKVTMWCRLAFILLSLVLTASPTGASDQTADISELVQSGDMMIQDGREAVRSRFVPNTGAGRRTLLPPLRLFFSERPMIFFPAQLHTLILHLRRGLILWDPVQSTNSLRSLLAVVCGHYHPAPTNFFSRPALLNFPGEPIYVDFTKNQWCEGYASSFWCIIPAELMLRET